MKSILEFVINQKIKKSTNIDIDKLSQKMREDSPYIIKSSNGDTISIDVFSNVTRNYWFNHLSENIKKQIIQILCDYIDAINKDITKICCIDFRIVLHSTTYTLVYSLYNDNMATESICNTKYIFTTTDKSIPKTFQIIKDINNKKSNATINDLVNFIYTGKL